MGFSYDGEGKDEPHFSDGEEDGDDDEDDDEEEDFNSDDSNDQVMESIAKDYGVKRYGWLVYMDKKAKEEERRQREVIKGDPAIVSLLQYGTLTVAKLYMYCHTNHAFAEEAESQRKTESFSIRKGEGKRSSPHYREQSSPS